MQADSTRRGFLKLLAAAPTAIVAAQALPDLVHMRLTNIGRRLTSTITAPTTPITQQALAAYNRASFSIGFRVKRADTSEERDFEARMTEFWAVQDASAAKRRRDEERAIVEILGV